MSNDSSSLQNDYSNLTNLIIVTICALIITLANICLSPETYDIDEEHRHNHNGTFDAVDNNFVTASSKRSLASRKHHLENRIVIRQITRPKNPTGSNDPSSSMRDSLRSYASQSERVYASFLSASLRSMNKGSIKFSQPIRPDAKDEIHTEADLEQGGVNDSTRSITSSSSTNKSRRTCNYVARQISSKLGNLDDTCGICLMEYEDGEHVGCSHNSECEHHFHKDCILNWLARDHSTCPVCRRDFLKKSDKAET